MRDSELDVVYRDYSFEPDMIDSERQACMDTIFQIQNNEIPFHGRYFQMPRGWIEYCCEPLSDQNDITLYLEKKTTDEDGKHWYARCPFCESLLRISENGVTIDELIGDPVKNLELKLKPFTDLGTRVL